MKRKTPLTLLVGLLNLALAPNQPLHGADDGTAGAMVKQAGSVSGRVQNVATGQYLNKARISVKGTDLIGYSGEFGIYRLSGIPPGPIVLEVFYTDLDVLEIPLNVAEGQALEQDVSLTNIARYGTGTNIVKLSPFVVSTNKEAEASALATNEQRFAPNLKNVISTDSLGNVLGNNVGEFLKAVPGLVAEYSSVEIVGVSVRGLGPDKTTFTTDGAPMTGTFIGFGRTMNIMGMSLNDVSRIEVTKVPTPSVPADSLAGSVNMITKSSFERSRARLRFGTNIIGNHENLTLKRTPFPYGDRYTRKTLVGFDFDYVLPINNKFGIVAAATLSDKFNEQHRSAMTWNPAGTATGASAAQPYLQTHALLDGPRNQLRKTYSLKADWKVTPNSVLTLGVVGNRYVVKIGNLTWSATAGAVGTPTPASGTPFSYSPTFTIGATGRGSVALSSGNTDFQGGTATANINYKFDNGAWRVEAALSGSKSDVSRTFSEQPFMGVNLTLVNPVRVTLSNINAIRPGSIRAFDARDQEVDLYNIDNYRVTTATRSPENKEGTVNAANLNLRKRIQYFMFPTAITVGGAHRFQSLDSRRGNIGWTYNGPDGNPNTIESPSIFLNQVYANQDSHFGFRNIPWPSATRVAAALKANPVLVSQNDAQVLAAEVFRLTNSEYIQESVDAIYLQAEASTMKNRLKILTGVRFEKTTDQGEGLLFDPNAVFVRNADGSFARNAQGARLRRPEAGPVGSQQENSLMRKERAFTAERSYDGYYPSLHLTYDIKENFLVRAAYARTYGRPDFANIIPNATISENDLTAEDLVSDPTRIRGTITVRNTGLRPWTANNYDLSLEYYTSKGGMLTAGVFVKDIRDFFTDKVTLATAADVQEMGLDPRYVGWNLATKFNGGDARITGAEFNVKHSAAALGPWARNLEVFANFTHLRLEGQQGASFNTFIPNTGNWGATFNRNRWTIVARWNYRGLDRRIPAPAFNPDGYQYIKERTTLDLNIAYQLTRHFSLDGSVNNLFNVPETGLSYGATTPEYARQGYRTEFGIALAVGLKGSF